VRTGRSALVVVPTLDLMSQWYATLQAALDREIGLIGGGYYEVLDLTVTTYDSAYLHLERLGHRFGMVIFDECHHLPGPAYAQAAQCCLAPYRLGLTATPEREDGRHVQLDDLIGPIVYRQDIPDLAGEYLAEYEVVALHVELTAAEQAAYAQARQEYLQFLREQGLQMSGPQGWVRFIAASCRSAAGRRAFQAYRLQKEIALAAPAKLRLLEALLHRHVKDQVLIFTHDNETVYAISRHFLVPAITHQTPVKERKEILAGFNQGEYGVIVTSRVLNEGVDMPAANVAVILSGSASVREHVQRLGRILRRKEGKRAVLYEVVTRGTAEENVSERRRQHHAYR
jgi:superfamily II DNA or RNA helicase